MLRLRSTPGLALALVLVSSAVACRSAPAARVSRATTTSAQLGSESRDSQNDDAVSRIATRRCEHELACAKIGVGRAFANMATCLDTVGFEVHRAVGAAACPSGIEDGAVARCLRDLDADPCGAVLSDGASPPSCRRAVLCWR